MINESSSKNPEKSFIEAERKLAVAGINSEMTDALVHGIEKGWDFKLLFKECTKNHKKNLSLIDEKVKGIHKIIFEKLCEDFYEEIQTENSKFLALALGMIADQTGDKENAKTFMDVFVLSATKSLIKKIESEDPAALKKPELWA